MKIYMGADHRGFELKEKLKGKLQELNYEIEDLGAYEQDPQDDYTVYAGKVGSVVGKTPESRGILICGSGIGVDVVANKFDGVRAGLGLKPEQVRAGRNDDDMNVLVIAADFTTAKEAEDMIKVFLDGKFEGADRFNRRLGDIKKIEENN